MSDTSSSEKDELAGSEQPFIQHLKELRDRLVKSLIAVAVACVFLSLFPGPAQLYDLLAAPLVANLPEGTKLIATSVISPFLVPLKILLMTGFLIALPVVLYQAWAFVAPGLYMHEKKLVLPLVISSTFCFLWVWLFVISLFLDRFSSSFKVLRLKASPLHQTLRPIWVLC